MGTMSVSATGGTEPGGLGSEAVPEPQAKMALARMVAQSTAREGEGAVRCRVAIWGAVMGRG